MVVLENDDINTKAIYYFLHRGSIDDGDEHIFDQLGCTPILVALEGNTAIPKKIDEEEVRCEAFSFQGFKY